MDRDAEPGAANAIVSTAEDALPTLPGSVDTPAVVLDLRRVERNVLAMSSALERRGVALRPHVKSHMTVAIAHRQLAAGAVGLTCASLSEAEVFARSGFLDLFVAYPVVASTEKHRRIRTLHERVHLRVGVDSETGIEALGRAVAGAEAPLEVLVEVDPGYHRTGVCPDDAGNLGDSAARAGLHVVGAFTHGGHAYDAPNPARIRLAARDETDALARAVAALETRGYSRLVASAGSTPTALLSEGGVVTEQRPGSYVLGDRNLWALGAVRPEHVALFVLATVVSTSKEQFVLDAGAKTLGRDRLPFVDGYGAILAYPGARIAWLDDHHGVVEHAGRGPESGDVVAVMPNSAHTALNLASESLVVVDGEVVDRWPVDARGCVQ